MVAWLTTYTINKCRTRDGRSAGSQFGAASVRYCLCCDRNRVLAAFKKAVDGRIPGLNSKGDTDLRPQVKQGRGLVMQQEEGRIRNARFASATITASTEASSACMKGRGFLCVASKSSELAILAASVMSQNRRLCF